MDSGEGLVQQREMEWFLREWERMDVNGLFVAETREFIYRDGKVLIPN